MPSTYGARHGLAGYDAFRTGLSFGTVKQMLRVESDNPSDWRHKRRGSVLGLWHSLKMALYDQACEVIARGPRVELVTEWDAELEMARKRYVLTGDVRAVGLRCTKRPECFVVIHRSTKRDCWQVSYFDELGAVGDHERPTLETAINSYELTHMYHIEEVV